LRARSEQARSWSTAQGGDEAAVLVDESGDIAVGHLEMYWS